MSGEDTDALLGGRAPARPTAPAGLFAALAVHLWLGYVQWQQGDLPDALQSMVAVHRAERAVGVELRDRPDLRRRVHDLHAPRPRSLEEAQHVFDLAQDGSGSATAPGCSPRRAPRSSITRRRARAGRWPTLDSLAGEMTVMENPVWRPWRSMRRPGARRPRSRTTRRSTWSPTSSCWPGGGAPPPSSASPCCAGGPARPLGRRRAPPTSRRKRSPCWRRTRNRLDLARALAMLGERCAGTDPDRARLLLGRALDAGRDVRGRRAAGAGRLGLDAPVSASTCRRSASACWLTAVRAADRGAGRRRARPFPDIASRCSSPHAPSRTIVAVGLERLGPPRSARAARRARPAAGRLSGLKSAPSRPQELRGRAAASRPGRGVTPTRRTR